jgi:hypothetical protein
MQNQDAKSTVTFETGATTAGANNLILSVLNDGEVYNARKHAIRAFLVGANPNVGIMDIVKSEVANQRKTGSKFKPAEITEAAKMVHADTIQHVFECIAGDYDRTKPIRATARRWFDKVNGNSYFSVCIQIPVTSSDYPVQINIPMQYGYGNQWQYETLETLVKIGVFSPFETYDNGNKKYGYLSDYETKHIIYWTDSGYGLKRDLFTGIYF